MVRIGSAPVAMALILALAACTGRGPTTEGSPPPGDAFVEVELDDFTIELPEGIAAGTVSFEVTNNGDVDHSFAVGGPATEVELEERVAPGEESTLTVDLQPGTYTVWCPIADHRDRGMEATFEVTEGPVESGAPLTDEGADPGEQEPITDDYSGP